MTVLEIVLLLAVAALATQVLILQRYCSEKLSDQAAVLSFLLDRVRGMPTKEGHWEKIRDKIFDSSH